MEQVPVLICGAGPVGLTMSILLSRFGIKNLVVEKRAGVSTLPRARGLMSRTVEIWNQFGVSKELDALSLPPEWCKSFIYMDTLAGDVIGEMPSGVMAPGACAEWTAKDFKCIAQDHVDSILWRQAKMFSEAEIRFSTEVTALNQDADGVTVTLSSKNGGAPSTIRAQWIIGADGSGSTVRQLAGIEMTGKRDLQTFVNCHFHADLSQWTHGHEAALIYTLGKGSEGIFQALDGDRRWMCQLWLDPRVESVDGWTDEGILQRVRKMIGSEAAEGVEFDLHSHYTYTLAAIVADRMKEGRVLLVGDAAHHVPPFGGIGLNTGIQTAHSLAWRLAAVIRKTAAPALLDSFSVERREVAHRVIDYCLSNLRYVLDIRRAQTREEQERAVAASRPYGNWAGLDLGVHYEQPGTFVDDGSALPVTDHSVIDYVPSAKPGYRAPHFWALQGSRRLSSIELFDQDFVLLTGEAGQPWIDAAAELTGIGAAHIMAYSVGETGMLVPDRSFTELYGITDTGAVLVRPDGHVAFRAASLKRDASTVLRDVLARLLGRGESLSDDQCEATKAATATTSE